MNYIEIEELLKVGAHFGHPTRKWNPKFLPYIATKKNGVHIIDLKIVFLNFLKTYNFDSEFCNI